MRWLECHQVPQVNAPRGNGSGKFLLLIDSRSVGCVDVSLQRAQLRGETAQSLSMSTPSSSRSLAAVVVSSIFCARLAHSM